MADSRSRGRRGARRAAAKTVPSAGKENISTRSTSLKHRLALFPDLDHGTPRGMLKRIIRSQPQVSPLARPASQRKKTEAAQSELPAKRMSSMGEMQLPDLVAEDTSTRTFHMSKKRKKLSISEFERAADRRLPQNQAQSTLDSTILARSLRMSLGSLIPADTVETRGLLRKPKHRKAIDMEAFEGGVEQNMLKRKAQDYLMDSDTASGIQTTILPNDVENVLSNTELFVQPQSDGLSQNKLSTPEPQLSDSKTSAQGSKISDAAEKEAGLVGLLPSTGTNEGRTQRSSEDLILDCEHVDRMTRVSPKTPASQQEDEQDHSQQSNLVEQLSLSEEVVVSTVNRWSSSLPSRRSSECLGSPVILKPKRSFSKFLREAVAHIIEDLDVRETEEEVTDTVNEMEQEKIFREERELDGAGAGSLGRHSHAFSSSEKSGMKQAVEQADQLEDQAIMVELDDLEEEPTEGEAEEPESEEVKKFMREVRGCRLDLEETNMSSSQQRREVSMKTPTFVRAAASKILLSTLRLAKPAAPNFPQKSPMQPLRAKPVPKRSRAPRGKTHEPEMASSFVKKIFSHYVKMPVARDAFKVIEKCSKRYFMQLSNDLEAYTNHAGRKTVEMADLEVLMRRQGLVTDKMPLHVLVERYLPLEYRKLLIPIAASRNKVFPCK